MKGYKYLYVHQFEWINEAGALDFNGEPKSGSVYRAEDNSKFFRVILSENQEYIGFHLEKKLMVGKYDNWNCDIEEINSENLFLLNISNRDLKMMAEDLPTQEKPEPKDVIMDNLVSSLIMLEDFDGDVFEAVVKVTTLVSDALASPSYIQLSDGMAWDERTAKVTNIAIASQLLESYLNEKELLKISDLISAIYQLTLESARIHKIAKINAGI